MGMADIITKELKADIVDTMSINYSCIYIADKLSKAKIDTTFTIAEWDIQSNSNAHAVVEFETEDCDASDNDIIFAYYMRSKLTSDRKVVYKKLFIFNTSDIIIKKTWQDDQFLFSFSFNVKSKDENGCENWIDINKLYDILYGKKKYTFSINRVPNMSEDMFSKYKDEVIKSFVHDASVDHIIQYMKNNNIHKVISFSWSAEINSPVPDYISGIVDHEIDDVPLDDLIISYKIWSLLTSEVKKKCGYIILLDQSHITLSCDNEDFLLSLHDPKGKHNWVSVEEMYLAISDNIQDIKKETKTINHWEDIKTWAYGHNLKYVKVTFSCTKKGAIHSIDYIHPNDAFNLYPSDFISSTLLFKDSIYPKYDTVILLHSSGIDIEIDDEATPQFNYQYNTARIAGIDNMYSYILNLIDEYNNKEDK